MRYDQMGLQAGRQGLPASANPFSPRLQPSAHIAWARGYKEAQQKAAA